jgi:hypothetical protein
MLVIIGVLAAFLPAAVLGCTFKQEPAAPFEIIVNVTSDPGHPLPGAIVMKAGKEGPSTGADGKVTVKIGGQEGESVELSIKCPADYVSPVHPFSVLLRRNAGTKLAEYEANCPPAVRHMVIAVRADEGPNLPVKVLGHVVGYTDGNGAFTYAIPLHPGEGVEMMLDTSANLLRTPQNPSKPFTMTAYDDVVTFDQKFQVAEVKKIYHAKQKPIAIGPRRGF